MKLVLKITDFIHKKRSIKMLAVILIVGIFFFHHAYAQEVQASTLLNDTQNRLDAGLALLSRVWIFLAMIAGKFMTNDVVYGAFMHLDKYLRAIRNVMKNFANFGLAFMILFSIIKYVVDKKGGGDNPKKIVVNALMAGVLIQVSRFAVGALVDISSVATSAVAAFPAKFIGGNIIETNVSQELARIMAKPKKVFKIVDGEVKLVPPEDRSDGGKCDPTDLDALMPKYDSVSGPLIFIGMSFFRAQEYMNQGAITDDIAGGGQFIINTALKVLILLAYVGCLIGLVIANLVRVLFLWILIMAAPIIILMAVFGKAKEGGGEGMMKYFNLTTFLDLIFKPVFFIGFLGLTLIFVTSMQQIMGGGKGIENMNGVTITSNTGASAIAIQDIAEFQVTGDVFGDITNGTKNVFVDLLLIVMTLLLLWQMLKRSISIGGGPVADVMSKITPLVESLAGTMPIIPTPGGESIGLSGMRQASQRGTQKALEGAGIKGVVGSSEFGKWYKSEEEFQARVNQQFLGVSPPRTNDDYKQLNKLISSEADREGTGNFFETLRSKGSSGKEGGLSLGNPEVKKLIDNRFKKYADHYPKVITKAGFAPGAYKSFEDFFGEKDNNDMAKRQNRTVLHHLLGDDANVENKRAGTPDYQTLMSNRYYMKEASK